MIELSIEEEKLLVTLGTVLQEFRVASNLRQRDLAAKIGVSHPVIVDMEKGRGGKVALATWIAAFSVLGILPRLKAFLETLEPDPFSRFEIRQKKKKRVKI